MGHGAEGGRLSSAAASCKWANFFFREPLTGQSIKETGLGLMRLVLQSCCLLVAVIPGPWAAAPEEKTFPA